MAKIGKAERKNRALALDTQVQQIMAQIGRSWVRLGRLCGEVKDAELYRELGYDRFGDWLIDRVGRHKSTIYLAMRAVAELAETVPSAELEKMTLANADALSRVPTSKRKELVSAAQTQTERQFRSTIDKKVPGLHQEDMVHLEFWLERSAAAVAERAIEKAMILAGTDSRAAAFEAIVADYDLEHPDPEKELERRAEVGDESELQPAN